MSYITRVIQGQAIPLDYYGPKFNNINHPTVLVDNCGSNVDGASEIHSRIPVRAYRK